MAKSRLRQRTGVRAPSFLPETAVLEMTYRCNHRCLFCSCPWYYSSGGYDIRPELTTREWKEVITLLAQMGVNYFSFSGGEALIKEDMMEIIEHTANQNVIITKVSEGKLLQQYDRPSISLLSNGKLIDNDILELCADKKIQLSLSLPGLRKMPFLTGGDPDYVIKALIDANSLGITTVVAICVTKENLPELYEIIAQGLISGADAILLNRFLPGGRGLGHRGTLMLTDDDILTMLDIADDVLTKAGRKGSLGTELPLCIIPNNKKYRSLQIGVDCSAAKKFFVVDPSGYIRVCSHSPVRLEHYKQIDDLANNRYWLQFVFRDYHPQQCSKCGAKSICDAGCREAAHICGGSIDAVEINRTLTPLP